MGARYSSVVTVAHKGFTSSHLQRNLVTGLLSVMTYTSFTTLLARPKQHHDKITHKVHLFIFSIYNSCLFI